MGKNYYQEALKNFKEALNLDSWNSIAKAGKREANRMIKIANKVDSLLIGWKTEIHNYEHEKAKSLFNKAMYVIDQNKLLNTSFSSQLGEKYFKLGNEFLEEGKCSIALKHLNIARHLFPVNEIEKTISLIEVAQKRIGFLNIYCEPWANIFIDGVDIKRTSPASEIKLICGNHKIKLINPDDSEFSFREAVVAIKENMKTKLIVRNNTIKIFRN